MKLFCALGVLALICCGCKGGGSGDPASSSEIAAMRSREQANVKLLPVKVNGKYGFIDRTGKMVVQPQFDGSKGFREGRGVICVGTCTFGAKAGASKYGYIDDAGKIVINPQYDDANSFVEGLAPVCSGDCSYSGEQKKWGFINKDGVMVVQPQFGRVAQFHGGVAAVCVGKCGYGSESEGKWGLINQEGKFVVNPQFDETGFIMVGGIIEVTVGKGEDAKKGYIDDQGNFIWQPSK